MRYVHRFIPVLALLFALGATSYAQSARRTVIQIPFDFVVGQKTLPAGVYRIEPTKRDSYTVLEIRGVTSRASAFAITTTIRGGDSKRQPSLVFEKYGETYVLAEVWAAGDVEGREVAQSRRGRSADAEAAAGRARKRASVTLAVSPR